ncbi:ABC transporter permease [Nonomuraea rubra]|uniref:ABC-2 type transport system permease protein n=1 Tax=Nonomuraea rubra TaxID=46180 RepID=A0A7X0P1N9_9ACTN|nr:ABC transporter permease [Nonomuraea rubra]MBB6553643.1 ABC-2 type transport system permease protein [Nonomuraea rubra]
MTGTWTLVRLIARRERLVAPVWILLLAVLAAGQLNRYATGIPDLGAFAREMSANRALTAFAGEVYASSVAAMAVWKNADAIYTVLGLIMILTVVRHTRGEEESGRAELAGSGAIGRLAPLTAALLVTSACAVLAGLVTAAAMVMTGAGTTGSFAFGAAITAAGLVFVGVGALAAQITQGTRAAIGLAAIGLGVSYCLRFIADGSGLTALKWLSPQGWSHLVRPYGDDNVAVLLLSLALFAVTAALAFRLNARRDLGLGLIPERPGPAHSVRLRSPLALAWRMQRGLLIGWSAGYAAAGLVLGALALSIPEVARQGAAVEEFFRRYTASPEATMTEAYLWLIVLGLGYVAALYPLLVLLRLRDEESSGRAELLLSTPVGRMRWACSHLAFAVLGSAVVLGAAGLTMGLVSGQAGKVLSGALIQVPAVWVLAGVGILAFGLLPRAAAAISWAAFLFVNLFGEVLGPIIGIDYWAARFFVPFPNLPMIVSGGDFTVLPILIMLAVAGLLTAAGLAGLDRRALSS